MTTTPRSQHPLERRASLLAQKLPARIGVVTSSLQAEGGRIPFHDLLSKPEARTWWSQHRYDQFGAQVLAGMDPLSVLQLDQELSQFQRGQQEAGLPEQAPGTGLFGGGS